MVKKMIFKITKTKSITKVVHFCIKESSILMIFLLETYTILNMLLWKLSGKEYYGKNY